MKIPTKTESTKPTLEECAELFRAANTVSELNRALGAIKRHGYTNKQVVDYLEAKYGSVNKSRKAI